MLLFGYSFRTAVARCISLALKACLCIFVFFFFRCYCFVLVSFLLAPLFLLLWSDDNYGLLNVHIYVLLTYMHTYVYIRVIIKARYKNLFTNLLRLPFLCLMFYFIIFLPTLVAIDVVY